ncbi:MAG: TRAP transporter substrate-binding protein [Rhodospirillum sp.]|nr:TRAP transporter substrate-binding protein [Rhodospirillum sp.]MCF8489727.1 TRAP transporter substrate-binding protein [Rhodospirillum sp.]
MKTFSKCIASTAILAAAAGTMSTTEALADSFVFAHGANPGNPRYDAANKFAELVSTCSNGAWTVSVAPSSTLGDDAEMLTSAAAGVIQMTANSQGPLAQIVPEVGALGLPFLFSDLPAVWKVLDGPTGDELDKKAQEAGLKIVTFWDNGIRHVTHVSKFVETPEDIKGMKIRTPPDQVTIATFEALGAAPAPLAWSELPTALRSGVFDGQENPLTNIYSAKLHEITPYISLTGHKYESTPVVAGLGWWRGLDDAARDCITSATKEAGAYQRQRSLEDSQKLIDVMTKEGAKFKEVDQEAFKKATASVYDEYEAKLGDFVPKLRGAAAAQ